MKYLLLALLFANLADAVAQTSDDMEVGAPKDCVVLGKTENEETDQHALQKQVMDCLGPQEETEMVELKKKTEVVSQ